MKQDGRWENGVTAYLGLGSNVGDREKYIREAVGLLATNQEIQIVCSSSLYETEPWGCPDQGWFLNAVIEIKTLFTPRQLLAAGKDIEKALNRTRTFRWGPRVIDIDILLYGQERIYEADLQIPHLYLAERAFVLVPLAEIAPDVPVFLRNSNESHTVRELLQVLRSHGRAYVYGPPVRS